MTVSGEETTEEISFPTKESKNRRTLSESDVNRQKNVEKSVHPPAASTPSRNPMQPLNLPRFEISKCKHIQSSLSYQK